MNLTQVGQGWTVKFSNTQGSVGPTVLVESAELVGNQVVLTVHNWSAQTQTVSFTGGFRYPSDPDTNVPFSYPVALQPGFNTVDLPLGNIRDAAINVEVNGFTDRAYIGSGYWFAFKNEGTGGSSSATLILPNCAQATNLTARDLILAGCPQITGTVGSNGWAGMARTLNPNDLPIDVSQYQALTFFAKGDGKSYRVNLETDSVRNVGSADFHQFVFTTSPEWRQFVIPLSAFTQQGWDASKMVPFTGKDVISVAWMAVSAPLESINLSIDRVAFVNSTVITGTTALPNTVDVAGPYTVTSRITDDQGVQTASLLYSVDNGLNFTRVPLVAQGNAFSASLPGQPLGTTVKYYIEATDADGNVATDPVDVPYTLDRFQVSQHPYLLVDDFADTNPINLLGGNSGAFNSETGLVLVRYDKESVQLDYDVSASNSYSGYYSLLGHANLTAYTAITFLVKGAVGGEKVRIGLRDSSLNETKLPIDAYLPAGITPSWQKVTVPLKVFTEVTDWSDMDNVNFSLDNWFGSGAGTIYVDDIKFEYLETEPARADLSITKSAPASPVLVGQTMTYTLQVTNAGPAPATGVTVTDALPAGVSYLSVTPSQGSCNGASTVTCGLGNLAAGASATVALAVKPTETGTVSNTASVAANEPDPAPANNTATAVTTVNPASGPDLTGSWSRLTQTCKTHKAITACTLMGTLSVRNLGVKDAPATLANLYLSSDAALDSGDTRLAQAPVRAIKAGHSANANLRVTLPTGINASKKYVIAVIDAANAVPEMNEANNLAVGGPVP